MFFSAEIAFFSVMQFLCAKKIFCVSFSSLALFFYGGFIVPWAQTFLSLGFLKVRNSIF